MVGSKRVREPSVPSTPSLAPPSSKIPAFDFGR